MTFSKRRFSKPLLRHGFCNVLHSAVLSSSTECSKMLYDLLDTSIFDFSITKQFAQCAAFEGSLVFGKIFSNIFWPCRNIFEPSPKIVRRLLLNLLWDSGNTKHFPSRDNFLECFLTAKHRLLLVSLPRDGFIKLPHLKTIVFCWIFQNKYPDTLPCNEFSRTLYDSETSIFDFFIARYFSGLRQVL